MMARFAARRPALWRRRVEFRLSIPIPLLAALVLLAALISAIGLTTVSAPAAVATDGTIIVQN